MTKPSIKGRKFSLQVSSIIPCEADGIFDELSKTHTLNYVGIYFLLEKVYLYIHTKNTTSGNNLMKIIKSLGMDITDIKANVSFRGEMMSEKGIKLIHGGPRGPKRKNPTSRTVGTINNVNSTTINNTNNTNNNINFIIVNPIGNESLDHITPEFLQKLLSEHHGPDVVFKFGTKMYSLQENMNFQTDPKNGFIKGRLEQDGAWETHRKSDGFNMLMDNLKNKNEQAVLKHIESLPYEDLAKFERDMGWIHEHKTSGLMEDVPVYQKFIRDGFNLLSANIADKKRRIERDTGKKIKLV